MDLRPYLLHVLLALAVSAVGLAQTPGSGVFFDEGWESGSVAATFNSSAYGSMTDSTQFHLDNTVAGRTGTWAIRHHLEAGMPVDTVDTVGQHFGDAPTPPVWATGAGQHFYDLYVHYRFRYSPGFDFGTGHYKQFMIGTQDDRRHDETCCLPFAAHYIAIIVEEGAVLQAEAYKKEAGQPRFDLNPNRGGYSDHNPFIVQTGRWYTMEVRRRLNDSGVDNGIFQMWVDGQLVAEYTNVRYRIPRNGAYGSNFTYGTNFALMTDYTITTVGQDQDVYYDDVKFSTQPIGSSPTPPPPPPPPPTPPLPPAPSNLRIIPGLF
ncbi:MAG: hypothetical protein IT179_09000 [Acidobacteria bacterium]|nr:hypothetical protein [Acidobacteriota bacterium]